MNFFKSSKAKNILWIVGFSSIVLLAYQNFTHPTKFEGPSTHELYMGEALSDAFKERLQNSDNEEQRKLASIQSDEDAPSAESGKEDKPTQKVKKSKKK